VLGTERQSDHPRSENAVLITGTTGFVGMELLARFL
jgi:hypothetical protein